MAADERSTGPGSVKSGNRMLLLLAAAFVAAVVLLVIACSWQQSSAGGAGTRIVKVNAYYPNNTAIAVLDHDNATDPDNGLLSSYLSDYGPTNVYGAGLICSDYAVMLHDTAESMGVRAHLFLIYFHKTVNPHIIAGFNTTDRGTVLVDPTGLTDKELAQGAPPRLRIAHAVPGQNYTLDYVGPVPGLSEDTHLVVDRVTQLC